MPAGDGVRFTQLQTLAQYGRERLTERGDAVRIRDAMARHYAAAVRRRAPPPSPATGQRAWLTAIDQEHDNLRAALEWAVANDDAETALMIAGGASWPHWLTGMVIEGKRWLDDAFACGGEADERTRALALTGRGLLDFLAGAASTATTTWQRRSRSSDATTTSSRWRWPTRSTPSRPPSAATSTRPAGAGWSLLDFYGAVARRPVRRRGARRTRWRSWPSSTATSTRPSGTTGPRPKASPQLDRPVMNSMCLGMVADFDERAGDYPAAITTLEAAIATNEALLGGFTGSLQARLGWVLLHDGQTGSAPRRPTSGRSTRRAACAHTMVVFHAQAGMAALHRLHGRDDAAVEAATEALELYRAGGFRRFRNRVDPTADLQAAAAVCCEVLAVDRRRAGRAGAGGDPARAGRRLRIDAGAEPDVPAARRRQARAAMAARRGRRRRRLERGAADAARSRTVLSRDVQRRARPQVSALLDGGGRPAGRGTRLQEDPVSAFLYRLGRSSARHPFRVLGLWLVAAIAVVALQGSAGGQFDNSERVPGVESQHAADVLNDRFPSQGGQSARIVLHTDDGRLDDADHAPTVDRGPRRSSPAGTDVAGVTDPFAAAVRRASAPTGRPPTSTSPTRSTSSRPPSSTTPWPSRDARRRRRRAGRAHRSARPARAGGARAAS